MKEKKLKKLMTDLEKLRELKPNWDSYNATTIDDIAIYTAKKLIPTLPSGFNWHVVPEAGGGVQIEASGQHVDIEIWIGKA